MIINPIIPVWLMGLLCAALLCLKRRGWFAYIRQVVAVVLIFLINLRIMVPSGSVEVTTQSMNTYVLFVIDDTISMLANDYNGDTERLTAVKEDCGRIVDGLDGAKFAVITFNNDANLVSPYTDNAAYTESVINAVYPINSIYAHGSSMNVCKDVMESTLRRAHEAGDGRVVVFFVSDGEITNDDELESFSDMKELVDDGAVLGYGTEKGGNMYVRNAYSYETELLEDTTSYPYKPAVSKIDESNLKSIADDMGISYINMNDGSTDDVVKNIVTESETADNKQVKKGYEDIYYIFAALLMVMLVWEFYLMRRQIRKV